MDDLTKAARRLEYAKRDNTEATARMNLVVQRIADVEVVATDSKQIDTLHELARFLEAYARHTTAMVEALDRKELKAKEKSS